MASDEPPAVITEPVEIVWPTKEQREKRLAEIQRYAPDWRASPALLIIKPHLGVIVSLQSIEHDEHYFALRLAVEETIAAPDDFDPTTPVLLTCVWNQPYLSLSPNGISAPYSFRLHFGAQGVQHVRELSGMKFFAAVKKTELLPGILSACFSPDFELPPE
jgi:hypothetical protein